MKRGASPAVSGVDLFCGVGGLTHGLRKQGIQVRAGFDIDGRCKYAYEHNNPGADFAEENVTDLTGEDLEPFYPKGELRLLAGCAPCQPFSTFRHTYDKKIEKRKKGGEEVPEDDKWPLLKSFGKLISEVRPHLVTMENVVTLRNHSVFKEFLETLRANGLIPWYKSIDCSKYGLPQRRRRLVLLASVKGEINLPNTSEFSSIDNSLKSRIGHLPKIAAGDIHPKDPLHRSRGLTPINLQRIQASMPGGTWKDWDEKLLPNCYKSETGASFKSVYGRMRWDKPASTITTQFFGYGTGRFGHPVQHRALSLREGALIQTFPPDYAFVENEKDISFEKIGQWIGNAVPVDLGALIAGAVTAHVKQHDWSDVL
jgi:DNA (cytosine-5)-methyltransferase 1